MMTTPDVEQSFIYLLSILVLATLGISFYFTLEMKFNLAIYYIVGSVMLTQFLAIYQSTQAKRQTVAAINLLEKTVAEDEGEEE